MNILFDTHTFLWFLEGDPSLSAEAVAVITDPGNRLYFSAASYWEMCIKISIRKLELKKGWEQIIERVLLENSIQWLNIKKQHMERIITLPWYHHDPFDRLLIAQAIVENCKFLTADAAMNKYEIELLY